MPMLQSHDKLALLMLATLAAVQAEPPSRNLGVRPSNVLGGLEQHASFSFVRPGLTQTAFAFNGPSSHQAFSSSVGDPHLAQRVLPSVANALAYRNPGLGYSPPSVGPVNTAAPLGAYQQQQYDYQQQQALALAYQQQYQQYQQYQQQQQQQQQIYPGYSQQVQAEPIDAASQQSAEQQAHLARLVASGFAGSHAQPVSSDSEQIQLQQRQQVQQANLLGVAYSAAPSVARVKVSGNGYKFDF